MIKYRVRLSPTEREQLSTLIIMGWAAAAKLLRARIRLKADVEAGERRWADTAKDARPRRRSLCCERSRCNSSY